MRSTAERKTVTSPSPPSTPRLRTQPAGPVRTLLDGAWWPRSADPVAELPGLILALDDRHGPVMRLMLSAADWDSHPRRLRIDDPAIHRPAPWRVVRLGWFDTMPAGLLTALCADGQRTDLLTIPPHTNPDRAQAAMNSATDPANLLHTPDILTATTTPTSRPQRPGADTRSEDTWESEGGRLIGPAAYDQRRPVALHGRSRSEP